MSPRFEIIKVVSHHNRRLFIFARQLDFKEQLKIKKGSLLKGIPVYHYLEMYPLHKEDPEPRFDIYVFRPMDFTLFKNESFDVGEEVELQLY